MKKSPLNEMEHTTLSQQEINLIIDALSHKITFNKMKIADLVDLPIDNIARENTQKACTQENQSLDELIKVFRGYEKLTLDHKIDLMYDGLITYKLTR